MMYDNIIIGFGLYGMYAALRLGKQGKKVLVLEYEQDSFLRATHINQARVHFGYHYPRSISTALKSKKYFERFNLDFKDSINDTFTKIYATSRNFSWTNADQFKLFCKNASIPCENIDIEKYFSKNFVDGAFLTKEYSYDSEKLKNILYDEIKLMDNIQVKFNSRITQIKNTDKIYEIVMIDEIKYKTSFILNATYASINQIHDFLGYENIKIKYELCEIILCKVSNSLKNVGITVMDGPFFSLMPFGDTGYHSLTSVTFTPHKTSFDVLPTFDCQSKSKGYCSPKQLGNCNNCIAKPKSAWTYMYSLAKKYLNPEFEIEYVKSLFSMKPILMKSEVDDSRPTLIKIMNDNPKFVTVLSGKINTIYDLDEVLDEIK